MLWACIKSEDNLNVAKNEKMPLCCLKDYKQKYDGFDPNSPEANIVFTLYQNAYLTQSLKFASAVNSSLKYMRDVITVVLSRQVFGAL